MPLNTILFGLLVACLGASLAIYFRQGPARLRQRLQVPDKPDERLVRVEENAPFLPKALLDKAEKVLGLKKSGVKIHEMKKKLVQAGFHSDRSASIFMGLKLGLAVALPVLTAPFLPLSRGIAIGGLYLLLVFGYFLPNIILGRLVQARQKKVKEGLPDALDLLVVCVEAGQGLNAALKRVAEELQVSNPILADELLQVNLEINAGQERSQALRNLAERTGVEEVASLCNILIQSERFGTSVAQTLKVQSESLRTNRRQKLEELAAKTPVKLVFPLIMFIFPAIMVVILGPAAIRITETLLK